MSTVDLISDFQDKTFVAKIAHELGVPENDHSAKSALRFLFACIKDKSPRHSQPLSAYQASSTDETLEYTSFKTSLYYEFAPTFPDFKKGYDHDGLITALICNHHIEFAELPAEYYEDDILPEDFKSSSGLETASIINASHYLSDIGNIETCGVPEGIEAPSAEAIFLLHITTFEKMNELEQTLENIDEDDLEEVEAIRKELEQETTYFMPYFRYDSPIGKELLYNIKTLRENLNEILNPLGYNGQAANSNDKKLVLSPV